MPKTNENSKLLERLDSIENLIKSNKEDKIMSFNECAAYIDMSKSYLYKLTMAGKILHYKPGGKKLYFSKIEIDCWIKEGNYND